ncbi:MAG: ArnT family glycosyltransferase [Flavobacteriales bacterium]
MKKESLYQYVMLSLFVLVIIANHVFGYLGHYGWDDMHYAEMANDVLQGTIQYNDHFFYRWPTVFLTAFSYKIFGINDFASALPAMGIGVGILFIVFLILKRYSNFILFVGLSLITLSNWFLFYTDKLMPDIFVAFFVLCVVATLYYFKFIAKETQPKKYAFLLALSLLIGFLSKETIVLILPVLAYLFFIEFFIHKKRTFWLYAIGFTVGLFTFYFLLLFALTGDAFIRFKSIIDNRYFSECSYHELPTIFVVKRIAYEFYEMCINSGMFISIVLILPVLFTKKQKDVWLLNHEVYFFSVVGFLLVLSSNFMSISYSEYIPMCIDPRHYLFIYPITSIAAAFVIDHYLNKTTNIRLVIILLGSTGIISLIFFEQLFWWHYFPLCLLFIVVGFMFFQSKKMKIVFSMLFFISLGIYPLQNAIAYQQTGYEAQRDAIMKHILEKEHDCIVISNDVQTRENKYYSGFNNTKNIQFVSFNQVTGEILNSSQKKLLILNPYTLYLSNQNTADLPFYATFLDTESNKTLYRNEELNLSIIELNKVAFKLIESTNNFEQEFQNWTYPKEQISDKSAKSETNANNVIEYSSTFHIVLDTVVQELASNLIIKTELYHLFKDTTEAQVVVSIESNNEVYFWRSGGLLYFNASDEEWKKIDIQFTVAEAELKPNSELKIFVWNPKHQPCLIDDFKITLIGFK